MGGACTDVSQKFHRASKYEKKDLFIRWGESTESAILSLLAASWARRDAT